MEKVVQQYIDRLSKDADTKTVSTSLEVGVDASTQYSFDDLLTDNTHVRVPVINKNDTISKSIFQTKLAFFTNFDKVGYGKKLSKFMIFRMHEILENMFADDNEITSTAATSTVIPNLISHLDTYNCNSLHDSDK